MISKLLENSDNTVSESVLKQILSKISPGADDEVKRLVETLISSQAWKDKAAMAKHLMIIGALNDPRVMTDQNLNSKLSNVSNLCGKHYSGVNISFIKDSVNTVQLQEQ